MITTKQYGIIIISSLILFILAHTILAAGPVDCTILLKQSVCQSTAGCTWDIDSCIAATSGSSTPPVTCGNGQIDSALGEQCDWNSTNAAINITDCNVYDPSLTGTATCLSDCTLNTTLCKPYHAPQNNQNTATPIVGWYPSNTSWTVTGGVLNATSIGSINSTPFFLSAGTNYTFSISSSAVVIVTFYAPGAGTLDVFRASGVFQKDIIVSQDNNYTLIITVQTPGTLIDNISLVEKTPVIFDEPTSTTAPYGCCYDTYCWNGNTCVNSLDWTNNSQEPPFWNSLNITTWLNDHVNNSWNDRAYGYRCTVNDSGYANWTLSNIKYGWDFKESGYCAHQTDCFVSSGFDYNLSDGFSGCIPNGTFIADTDKSKNMDFALSSSGDRYCLNGNWTTRTALMALALENISQGTNFILFCGNAAMTFNNNSQPGINPTAACTLIMRHTDGSEQVINTFTTDLSIKDALLAIGAVYQQIYSAAIPTATSCSGSGSFLTCIEYEDSSNSNKLYLYYNNETKYFMMSTQKIPGVTTQNTLVIFWNTLVAFFKRIFGITTTEFSSNLALQKTSNFAELYILRNNSLIITGTQEQKYDEAHPGIYYFTYLNYTDTKNPAIGNAVIMDPTYLKMHTEDSAITSASGSQEVILRYNTTSDLWPYFTAVLRDR